jgi:hypothetical protein
MRSVVTPKSFGTVKSNPYIERIVSGRLRLPESATHCDR